MNSVQKEYTHPFLVEPTKLNLLIQRVHEWIIQGEDAIDDDRFEEFLPGNRVEQLSSLDEVLKMENSRKKKIERLLIVCSGYAPTNRQVEIDFGVVKVPLNSPPSTNAQRVIAVTVKSNDSAWNYRVLSEIEEHIERTELRYISSSLLLVGVLIGFFVLLLVALPLDLRRGRDLSRSMWLDDADLQRVEQILGQEGRTLTEEEMRQITTIQLRNVIRDQKPRQPAPKGQSRRWLLIGLPMLFCVGCVIALVRSYPTAVFRAFPRLPARKGSELPQP